MLLRIPAVAVSLALLPWALHGQVTNVRALDGGIALFEQRRYEEAKGRLRHAAEAYPADPRPAYYLGRIALIEGNAKEGVKWLERAARTDPESAECHRWLGRAYAREVLRASKLRGALIAGRIRGAFERAVALDPDDLDARFDLLQFYLAAPGIVGGSKSKGREQASEIAKRSVYRGRIADGLVAEREDDVAAALHAYESAIELEPDSAVAYYALGALHQRADAFDRADDTYRKLLARRPDETAAYYHIGRTASLSGERLDEAERALRTYLEHAPREGDPSLASAHYRLAIVYQRQGDTVRARQEYATTVRLDPSQKDAREALKRLP